MSKIIVVNPVEREYARHRFVLWFGACAPSYLMVWSGSLEDAIEECAAWLAEHAPGHVMTEWSDDHKSLIADACADRGIAWPSGFEALEDDDKWQICEDAEADMTRTESGFLTSYEWGICLEDPTRAELLAFASDIGATFVATSLEV